MFGGEARRAGGLEALARGRSWLLPVFFFSSRRRHTRLQGDWSSDVCSSDLHHDRAVDLAFFDASTRCSFLDGHLDDVTNTRIATMGTAQHFDALNRLRAGEIGRASCRERV